MLFSSNMNDMQATGFTDTVPIIREQTIKSILYLVPKV